eukprot:228485_1
MDQLSVWINNKQLLDMVTSKELESVQCRIIEEVFGGFDKMLQSLMHNYNQMTMQKHLSLYNILLTKHNGDIYDNYKTNKRELCITDISDDCWTYIMKFMNHNDMYSVQQTCRLFAVVSRNETIFGHPNSYFSSSVADLFESYPAFTTYNITPNKIAIINGLLSNEETSKLKSIKYISAFITNKHYGFYSDVKNYSQSLQKIIETHIVNNITTDENCIEIFNFELKNNPNKQWLLEVLPQIFAHKLEHIDDSSLMITDNRIINIVKTLSLISKRYIFDMMKQARFISSLIKTLCSFESYVSTHRNSKKKKKKAFKVSSIFDDFYSDDDPLFGPYSKPNRDNVLQIGINMFIKILNCGYNSHREMLFQNEFMFFL